MRYIHRHIIIAVLLACHYYYTIYYFIFVESYRNFNNFCYLLLRNFPNFSILKILQYYQHNNNLTRLYRESETKIRG